MDQLDKWVKRSVCMQRRTDRRHWGAAVFASGFTDLLDQPRLTEPGFSVDKIFRMIALLGDFPGVFQFSQFVFATDERRHIALAQRIVATLEVACALYDIQRDRCGDAPQRCFAATFIIERILQQSQGRFADQQLVWLGQRLDASGDVRCVAQREPFTILSTANVTDHHRPRMDTNANLQRLPVLRLNAGHGVDNFQPTRYRAQRRVFIGNGVAEVDQ